MSKKNPDSVQPPKVLSFIDAAQLASILSPYVVDDMLTLKINDFSTKIIELLSVDDLSRVVKIIVGRVPSLEESKDGMHILKIMILGFMVNRVQPLIKFYRELSEIK